MKKDKFLFMQTYHEQPMNYWTCKPTMNNQWITGHANLPWTTNELLDMQMQTKVKSTHH